MIETNSRINFGPVMVGAVVAAGCATLPLLLGTSLYGAAVESGLRPRAVAIGAWAAATFVIAGYLGGRFAAVSGRAMLAREGGLYGLVTWCTLSIAAAIAIAALGRSWIAGGEVVQGIQASLDAQLLLVGVHLISLGACVFGGMRGARAEARASGQWPVYDVQVDDTPAPVYIPEAPIADGPRPFMP